MNELIILENVFKPFEALGLHCFSFTSMTRKFSERSINSKLYVGFAWLVVLSGLALNIISSYTVYHDSMEKSDLILVMKAFTSACFSLATVTSLVISLAADSKLVKFFRIMREACKLFEREFKYVVDLRKLRKKLATRLAIVTGIYVFAISIDSITFDYSSKPVMNLVLELSVFIPIIFIHMVALRFMFYVETSNFLLQRLTFVIRHKLSYTIPSEPFRVMKIQNIGDFSREVIALRKIYSMIQEMADIVNETMGIPIVFILLFNTVSLVRAGYKLIVLLIGLTQDRIERKMRVNDLKLCC